MLLISLMAIAGLIGYIISGILSDKYNPAYIHYDIWLNSNRDFEYLFWVIVSIINFVFWPLHVFFVKFFVS